MVYLKIFLIAFVVFVVTDAIWLGLIAKGLYFKDYAPWLRITDGELKPLMWAAAIVYILFAFGVVLFIFPLAGGSAYQAAAYGAGLGLIIYGVYDFTLLAIMKDWPLKMAFVDWAWGTFLCGWSAAVTCFLYEHFFN